MSRIHEESQLQLISIATEKGVIEAKGARNSWIPAPSAGILRSTPRRCLCGFWEAHFVFATTYPFVPPPVSSYRRSFSLAYLPPLLLWLSLNDCPVTNKPDQLLPDVRPQHRTVVLLVEIIFYRWTGLRTHRYNRVCRLPAIAIAKNYDLFYCSNVLYKDCSNISNIGNKFLFRSSVDGHYNNDNN